jgi:chromosome segregation ATPase
MRCHIAEVSFDLQGSDSKSSAFKEAPGGSSNSGSDAQELSMQLQQVKEQLAESQRNAQTWMDASLQCQTELDESAQQLEDAQQHVQILQDRLDQEERQWAQLSHRLTIPTVPLVSHSSALHHTC